MWKYVKPYLPAGVIAALFMVGEVMMDLLQPKLMSTIVDDGVLGMSNQGQANLHLILIMGLWMIVSVIAGGAFGSLNNVFVNYVSQNTCNDIRKDCFRNIMTFSFPQIDQYTTGSLITRVTNDITLMQYFVSQFMRGVVRMSMLTCGSIFFMFQLHRSFGIIVLSALPFMVGILILCLYKANPLLLKIQQKIDHINSIMQEDVNGIRIIKACVREVYEKLRFHKANDALIKTQLQMLVIFAFMNPLMNVLMYIVIVIIILAGNMQVLGNTTTPGTIMAAITYTTQLLNGILMLVMVFQQISRGYASWKRVKEVLYHEAELKDGTFHGASDRKGKIEFRNVSFAYPGSEQTVLHHINLTIEPKETIAIMGATGCGKTTLVNLIPRFYDVSEGEVLVDGVDVRSYDQHDLRNKISIAIQKSELFSRSLKENIAWGMPAASDEDIQMAASIAQADDFIRSAPEGYDTKVAEAGMSLSGGQKQRISIARAVLKPAEILILDDASSALDLATEARLYEALRKQKPDVTKIIIAQRIASVRHADRIVVLQDGGIEACGSHEELMKISKTYQDIYYSQMGNEGEFDE